MFDVFDSGPMILLVIAIIVAVSLIIFIWHNRQDEKRFSDLESAVDKINEHLGLDQTDQTE